MTINATPSQGASEPFAADVFGAVFDMVLAIMPRS
jgi:hypothetical protein